MDVSGGDSGVDDVDSDFGLGSVSGVGLSSLPILADWVLTLNP